MATMIRNSRSIVARATATAARIRFQFVIEGASVVDVCRDGTTLAAREASGGRRVRRNEGACKSFCRSCRGVLTAVEMLNSHEKHEKTQGIVHVVFSRSQWGRN